MNSFFENLHHCVLADDGIYRVLYAHISQFPTNLRIIAVRELKTKEGNI